MNIFFQRFVLFLLLVILQRSFFDVIWPSAGAPIVIISLIVSLVFLEGFERGGLAAIFALTLYLLLGQNDLVFVVFAVVIGYGTSFLSRRLVIERPVQTSFILTLASVGFVLTFDFLSAYLANNRITLSQMVSGILQTLFVFPLVFFVLKAWEKYVRESAMSEFRGMRT